MTSEDSLNKHFLTSCPQGVMAFDLNKKITAWNPAIEILLKIPASAALGKSTDSERMPAFFKDSPRTFIEEALRGKHFTVIERDEIPHNPILEITYFPLIDNTQKIAGGMALFKEINQQILTHKTSLLFQDPSYGILEAMNEAFVTFDQEWRYTYVNQHAANSLKLPAEEIIGKKIWDFFPETKELPLYQYFQKAMKERKPIYFEDYIPAINKWFGNRIYPINNGIAVFFHDITHRKEQQNSIEQLNTQLEEQNKNLLAQEEELRSQQEDLKRSLLELEERNFELDQIMYKTSHDLRSPLTSIMGLVNLAKMEEDSSTIFSYILLIENRIAKLDEFVRSMLDFSKASRTPLEAMDIDFYQIIDQCFQSLQFIPAYQKVAKNVTITGTDFKGDALRLRIIFTNLISNAIKYTDSFVEDPSINIDVKVSPEFAIILIRDNGIGIKSESLSKVFDMFFRGTQRSEGSGLGLYIVKQVVDKLGGSIAVDSMEGKGTNIQIRIPNLAAG